MAENKGNKPTPEQIAAAQEAKKAAKGGEKKGGSKKASHDSPAAKEALVKSGPPRLKTLYDTEVRAKLASEKGVKNPMAQPRLDKIVINVNMGRLLEGSKVPPEKKQTIIDTLTKITGQKPVVIKAKKSVSNFKLREGFENAVMVTLRRDRMWHFLDRMINLVTPRIKDFRGLNRNAFDKGGSYAFGLTEQGVFPEINMAEVNFTHGMHINLTFKNSTPELSRFVLEQMGFPFQRLEENQPKKKSA